MTDGLLLPAVTHRLDSGFEISFGPMRLEAGERLVLFGPNGAGKTTVLRLLAAAMANKGSIHTADYQPQRPYMFRGTMLSNLCLGLSDAESKHAELLAAELGLAGRFSDSARSLS